MGALRFVLGDQLTHSLSALDGVDPARDAILLAEVVEEASYVRHHKQKIALIFSAMRHFASELEAMGLRVAYVRLDDPENSGTLSGELARAAARFKPDRIILTEPGEYRVLEMMRGWPEALGLPVDIRDDDRFFCSRGRFARWAGNRKSYRMEFFYREMRRETGILMNGDEPEGGRWNFDAENRKRLPASLRPPPRARFEPDEVTRGALDLVERRFGGHFGDSEPFGWAVTRADALEALEHFMSACLPLYGDYQDAMKTDEPFLYHSILSPYLNVGLLTPHEVCLAAERAFRAGLAPLNAAEGFIRQILGWREYVRGIYWLEMPDYPQTNALEGSRDLPAFYWSGETGMKCLAEVVAETRRNAYSHHIQRLMITGNFALLAGIEPRQIEAWFLAVYADAFEWVELPNTHGMALFADGGLLASKPYAASGAYISRMSNYCETCAYSPKLKSGPQACPFNFLYWNFMIENQERLGRNPRLAMAYRALEAMGAERRKVVVDESQAFLATFQSAIESAPEKQLTLDF